MHEFSQIFGGRQHGKQKKTWNGRLKTRLLCLALLLFANHTISLKLTILIWLVDLPPKSPLIYERKQRISCPEEEMGNGQSAVWWTQLCPQDTIVPWVYPGHRRVFQQELGDTTEFLSELHLSSSLLGSGSKLPAPFTCAESVSLTMWWQSRCSIWKEVIAQSPRSFTFNTLIRNFSFQIQPLLKLKVKKKMPV